MIKERCFAERRDGKCHALTTKRCEFCSFYTPRSEVKNNPFYRWSYKTYYKAELDRKERKIKTEDVMKKAD